MPPGPTCADANGAFAAVAAICGLGLVAVDNATVLLVQEHRNMKNGTKKASIIFTHDPIFQHELRGGLFFDLTFEITR